MLERPDRIQAIATTSRLAPSLFVDGFPKSGTTWVTMLLAHALRLQLAPVGDAEGPRVASYNSSLGIREPTPLVIRHCHFLPDRVAQWHGTAPVGTVYVYRDVRDALVSSFFFSYDHYLGEFLDRRRPALDGILGVPPVTALKSLRWNLYARRQFRRHIRQRSHQWSPEYGGWTDHVRQWRAARGWPVSFVSYEGLLSDTAAELRRVISELGLRPPGEQRLARSIEFNSFAAMRTRRALAVEQATNPAEREQAEIYLRFCRRGTAGDWRNFLTRKLGREIEGRHGDMLRDLGYDAPVNWWREL